MIKILCGDNLIESRKAVMEIAQKAKEEEKEVVILDGAKTEISQIRSAVESGSMFNDNRLILIENFLSSQKSTRKQQILDYLLKNKSHQEIILWEGKNVDKRTIPSDIRMEVFKLDQKLFKFLDSLQPGIPTKLLELLIVLKQKQEPEMIFYMLTRQIRLLILAKENLLKMAPWQEAKLNSQAKLFSLDQLKDLYAQLLEIDYNQKTGNDAYNLTSRLDLLISSL